MEESEKAPEETPAKEAPKPSSPYSPDAVREPGEIVWLDDDGEI